MSIETVLFDLDGTILDSNELIHVSFTHTFERFNIPCTKEDIISCNGPPLRETFNRFGSNPEEAEEMLKTYRAFNLSNQEQYVKVFPDVFETLERLLDKGIKIGIVTSKMRDSVQIGLDVTGLGRYFETIVTFDDVVNPKPHPEAVLKAMKELNGDAETTLMVGDNSHDIVSGNKAGVQTAGVAWSEKGEAYLAQYEPTYMLHGMKDLFEIVGV